MINPGEQERRDELIQLLFDLAKSQDVLREKKDRIDYYLRLEKIYYIPGSDQYFRHYYSDIFSTLTQVDSDDTEGSIDILAQNLQSIKDGYKAVNHDSENDSIIDIGKSIIKLLDHTNLEIARINYTKTLNNDTKSELARAKSLVDMLCKQIENVNVKNKEFEERLKSESANTKKEIEDNHKTMQNEYVTILGIFAAIVLAFTGGLAFSSSVLNNIAKSSAYRICIVAFIIGIVFFNLIWILIDFIRDINNKSIRKNWLFIVVNSVLIGGIIGTCLAHKFQWFA